ncbi:hypothetical protein FJY84_08325 [Candidatus Bathyarchaeota archaeon]|nr:hypothetical protein [Candidatus Bathyarchaeota archaeon]
MKGCYDDGIAFPNSMFSVLAMGIETLIGVAVLFLIGIIIIMITKALLFFLPAVVISGLVYFITGNEIYAALSFVAIAVLSLIKK